MMGAMPNAAQIERWDGPTGQHWVAEAARYDRMNRAFAAKIVDEAAPQAGVRVLDVGCGNGALALAISPLVLPGGTVMGLDISGPMLEEADRRARAAGISNVSLQKGDCQVYPLASAAYDVVVSRFGVMFFDDPRAAFANLAQALRPGGRLVFACWREVLENEWLMVPVGAALAHVPMPDLGEPGGPGPFSLADPERVRELLADAGLRNVRLQEMRCPMQVGHSVDDAVAFMQGTEMADMLMKDVDPEIQRRAWESVTEALAARSRADGSVELTGSAWLVTATTG
jgi:SAM-dependent methyltransferase